MVISLIRYVNYFFVFSQEGLPEIINNFAMILSRRRSVYVLLFLFCISIFLNSDPSIHQLFYVAWKLSMSITDFTHFVLFFSRIEGSVYKRINPGADINIKKKDSFWEKQEVSFLIFILWLIIKSELWYRNLCVCFPVFMDLLFITLPKLNQLLGSRDNVDENILFNSGTFYANYPIFVSWWYLLCCVIHFFHRRIDNPND